MSLAACLPVSMILYTLARLSSSNLLLMACVTPHRESWKRHQGAIRAHAKLPQSPVRHCLF